MRSSITAHELDDDAEIVQYYDVMINDKKIMTTVTSDPDYTCDWLRGVIQQNQSNPLRLILGLDIKFGSPQDKDEDEDEDEEKDKDEEDIPVAVLVLCVYRSCLVYSLAYAQNIPQALSRFLRLQDHTYVGVGIRNKLERLRDEYGIGGGAWYNDLADLVASRYPERAELKDASLSEIRRFCHGSDFERPAIVDVWDEDEVLSKEHVHHACIDAFTSYELGVYLEFPYRRGTPETQEPKSNACTRKKIAD